MKTLSYWILGFICLVAFNVDAQSGQTGNHSHDSIVPFHDVNGIIPGLSKYSDVVKLYGPPEEVEIPKEKTVAGISTGGNRIIHYRSKGMSFLLTNDADAIVEAVYVEAPFGGRTPNGLFLGMKKNDAVEIIKHDYHISLDLGESLLIARSAEHADNFQVWFTAGILTRMKLFAY